MITVSISKCGKVISESVVSEAKKLSPLDQKMYYAAKSGWMAVEKRGPLLKHLKAILSGLKKGVASFVREYKAELKGNLLQLVDIYTKPLLTKLEGLVQEVETTSDPEIIESLQYLNSPIASTRTDEWNKFLGDSGVKRGAFKELANIIPDGYNFNLADGLYDAIMQVILTEDRYLK